MLKNILIVVEQAVNQCLQSDLSKFEKLEVVISATQKTLPIEFVKELLRLQGQSGIPVDLLTMKGNQVELYLAWLLGRHTIKEPEATITVMAQGIDAQSLLDNCMDEESHDRIVILSDGSAPAAAAPKESATLEFEKPVAKKAPIETVAEQAADPVKAGDNKLISKLMERNLDAQARHPITGEPLPEPLNK